MSKGSTWRAPARLATSCSHAYRAGAATLIDYMDAERALREALRTLNRARFDYRVSQFQYAAAVDATGSAR